MLINYLKWFIYDIINHVNYRFCLGHNFILYHVKIELKNEQ